MREKFENRLLRGQIKVTMDAEKGVWIGDKMQIVSAIVMIANEYQNEGYVLTLRQLYYQLVARDIIPNHDKIYKKISAIKDDVVYSGLVDWKVFEDRGRVPSIAYYEHSVEDALQRTIDNYHLDRQRDQPIHIEVWTEKDAISSILKRATHKKTIRLVVNKGYSSSTAMYGAYERFLQAINEGKKVKVLYFGDHDPSGIDMVRDIKDRIMNFMIKGEQWEASDIDDKMMKWWEKSYMDIYDLADLDGYENVAKLGDSTLSDSKHQKYWYLFDEARRKVYIEDHELFEVIPVGLTMDQINKYNPPPNPAKVKDPRAKEYIANFGEVSWEVDALKPAVMLEIVNKAIDKLMDSKIFDRIMAEEKSERDDLKELLKNYKDEEE